MGKSTENDEMTREQRKAILDERAAFLAQAQTTAAKIANQLDVLEIVISGERYAIEAKFVREASKLFRLTPIPCTPEFVLGLINFRGQILPLLDLRKILEIRAKEDGVETQVVVIQTATASAGIAVDEITGITSIPEAELRSPKQLMRPSVVSLFKGIRNDRLAVLDIELLFSDERLIVDSKP